MVHSETSLELSELAKINVNHINVMFKARVVRKTAETKHELSPSYPIVFMF